MYMLGSAPCLPRSLDANLLRGRLADQLIGMLVFPPERIPMTHMTVLTHRTCFHRCVEHAAKPILKSFSNPAITHWACSPAQTRNVFRHELNGCIRTDSS